MKTFMRTESGLKAYKRFHRADFMVYIEGKIKIDEPQDAHDNYKDVKYYTEVLTAASNGKTPKIKCVGNKKSVIDYVKEINKNKIPNSVVIVDKDLEGITSTTLSTPSLIVTVGYSWENELWNINTALSVIDMLTQSNIKALYETKKFLPRIQKRLKILSALDIVLQTNGSKLLKKSTSLGGINFTPPYLKSTEISRIIDKYRETQAFQCDFSKEILKFVIQKNPEEVIQGEYVKFSV